MSRIDRARGLARPGFATLTAGLALAATIGAILALDSQIEVFGFGDAGPDARSFPRMILWLLAAVLSLRLIAGLRSPDDVPSLSGLGRVLAISAISAAGLWAVPHIGFLAGSAVAGVGVAIVLGERRPLLLGVPLIVAAVVTYGARHGLGIPLP